MSAPNQRVVTIKKEPCSKKHLHIAINLDALQQAAFALKGETFKLWVYFSKYENSYQLELNQKAVTDWTGMSKATYYRAIEELIEKGYLVSTDDSSLYNFYEIPRKEKQEKPNTASRDMEKNVCCSLEPNSKEKAGIYCIKVNGKITYVGKSINIPQRFSQHRRAIETNYPEAKYRLLKAVKDLGYKIDFEILYISKANGERKVQDDIGRAESIYINKYKPILNTIIPNEEDWHRCTHNDKVKNLTIEEFLEVVK